MPNNGMHPTRDTLHVIKLNLAGGRVMPSGLRLPYNQRSREREEGGMTEKEG